MSPLFYYNSAHGRKNSDNLYPICGLFGGGDSPSHDSLVSLISLYVPSGRTPDKRLGAFLHWHRPSVHTSAHLTPLPVGRWNIPVQSPQKIHKLFDDWLLGEWEEFHLPSFPLSLRLPSFPFVVEIVRLTVHHEKTRTCASRFCAERYSYHPQKSIILIECPFQYPRL